MGLFGARKPEVKVRLKVAGFVDGRMVTAEFELGVPEGATMKEIFKLADKSGRLPPRSMKKILAMAKPPTVLQNGQPIDVPDELHVKVVAGDEIAIMTPLGGG